MIRSWRMEWAGHVASMEKKRKAHRVLVVEPEGKRTPLEDLALGRMTMLKWILHKKDWRAWTGAIWLRRGAGGGLLCTQ